MAFWATLKNAVNSVIKTNDNKEITGQVLQNVLNNVVSVLGENATFAGIATTATNPGIPDGPVFYIAVEPGIYSNFDGYNLYAGYSVIFKWNGTSWNNAAFALSYTGYKQMLISIPSMFSSDSLLQRTLLGVIKPNYRRTSVTFNKFWQGNAVRDSFGELNRIFSQSMPIKPGSTIHVSWENPINRAIKVIITEFSANGEVVVARVWHESNFDITLQANTVEFSVCVANVDDTNIIADIENSKATPDIAITVSGEYASTGPDTTDPVGKLSSFRNTASIVDNLKEPGIYARYDISLADVGFFLYVDSVVLDWNNPDKVTTRQVRGGYVSNEGEVHFACLLYTSPSPRD